MAQKYYYTFTTKPVKEGGFAEKLDKFTYGLLYPAFFGNMIYDLILGYKPDKGIFDGWRLVIGIGIVLFNIVDFMHLYVDVENSIGRELKNKNWCYIICDLLASIGIFVAFVLVKNLDCTAGLWLFCLVPGFIALYKLTYHWISADKKMNIGFAIASIALAIVGQVIYPHCKTIADFYPCAAMIISLIFVWYSVYAFYFYPRYRGKTKKKKRSITTSE